jgi:hypothetical protein
MKKLLLYLVLLFAGSSHAAAQSLRFEVNFPAGTEQSPVFTINLGDRQIFTGITAYTHDLEFNGAVFYRTGENAAWGEWKRMMPYHEGELVDRMVFEGEPIRTKPGLVQFMSTEPAAQPLIFRLFTPYTAGFELPRRFDTPPSCTCPLTPVFTTPTHIIVHHSAGFNNSDDFKAVVAYYWDFHVNSNGWDDIAYNWLIDPNGVLYEGRGSGVLGSHFSCMNTGTTGICMIGDFQATEPSPAAMNMLEDMIAWELCDKQLNAPDTTYHNASRLMLPVISSHRDGNSSPAPNSCASGTVCPGDRLYEKLPALRRDVENMSCLHVTGISGTDEELVLAYPIPASDVLNVVFKTQQPGEPSITNILGQEVKVPFSVTGDRMTLDIHELPEGNYNIRWPGGTVVRFIKLRQ